MIGKLLRVGIVWAAGSSSTEDPADYHAVDAEREHLLASATIFAEQPAPKKVDDGKREKDVRQT